MNYDRKWSHVRAIESLLLTLSWNKKIDKESMDVFFCLIDDNLLFVWIKQVKWNRQERRNKWDDILISRLPSARQIYEI